jgi:dihydrofolate synthase/folylpolyglutamate synthase
MSQPPWSYEQALAFWYGRINYEQRSPRPEDLTLDRMEALLALLGHPERALRIVHVAGSKGKGSTAAMLAAVLRRAGYRTGLFTSPHLSHVEERMQVDGVPVSREELAALVSDLRPAVLRLQGRAGRGGVTFFEMATALGFLHFVRRRVEVAVVEVGLGGRFDSTNVCRPLLAVITSISHDHTQQLGNTLDLIAGEKAGIVKPGRPTLSGASAPEARAVIERVCRERQSPLREIDRDFDYRYEPGRITAEAARWPRVRVRTDRREWPWLQLGLLGEHQAANAALAVATLEELNRLGLRVGDAAVAGGLANVYWPARMEVVGKRPLVVLDCAHNVASARALADTLGSFPDVARRHLVFAASADKDVSGMLRILGKCFDHAYLTRYRQATRGLAVEKLAEAWRGATETPYATYAAPEEAWRAARAVADAGDLICVTGSVFLAGELRRAVADFSPEGARFDSPGRSPGDRAKP